MIPEIKTLVGERGSRTQIRFLKTSLDETLKSAIEHHEALMILLPDDDPRFSDEWIEELALSVNTCFAVIEAYLNDRKDDPPSTLSSEKRKDIQHWRENSRNQSSESTLSDMCDAFSNLYVQQSQTIGAEHSPQTTLQDEIITQTEDKPLSLPSPSEVEIQRHETIEIDNGGAYGGARPREPVTSETAMSKLTNTKRLVSPIQSTRNFSSTYLNPIMDDVTPKLQGEPTYSNQSKNPNELHSTYTIQTQNSPTDDQISFHVADGFDPYEPSFQISTSRTVSPINVQKLNSIRHVDTLATSYVNTLPTSHVNTLPTSYVNTLPTSYVNTLPTSYVNTLPTSYFNTLPTSHVNTLPTSYVNTLPTSYVNSLQTSHVNTLRTPHVKSTNHQSRKPLTPHINVPKPHVVANSSTVSHHANVFVPSPFKKSLDQWIDELDPNNLTIQDTAECRNVQMELLIQQRLPRQELITFAGEAEQWIEFVSKFYDIVHKQPYLDSFQKRTYLTQHLKGEALKSVEGFSNDNQGYVYSLQKLKYLFGNKIVVAQSVIRKITKGRQVPEYDSKALANFYFEIAACLNTLVKMNYVADIYSTDLLRQTLSKLPVYLQRKWSEYSLSLRRREEPNLYHLEKWLQDRVMAARDPYLTNDNYKRITNMHNWTSPPEGTDIQIQKRRCSLCSKDHMLYRCVTYKSKSDAEKLSFVRKKRLCFNCLGTKHTTKYCKSKKHCFIDGCKMKHHTTLHQASMKRLAGNNTSTSQTIKTQSHKPDGVKPTKDSHKTEDQSTPDGSEDGKEIKSTINGHIKGSSHVYLQVVPVRVKNERGFWVETYAMLDTGSQCTLITKSLCKELNLQGRKSKINFGTIRDSTIIETKLVDITIAAADGTYSTNVKNVYSIDDAEFNVPGQEVPLTSNPEWDYIRDLDFRDIDSSQVQLLIGTDVPDVLISYEFRKGKKGYPYASKTNLGWTLLGVYDGSSDPVESRIVALNRNLGIVNVLSESEYQSFWETESFGTEVQHSKSRSVEDQRNQDILDKGTEFKEGHYVVPMLWRNDVDLPESQTNAERRLNQICRKFQANPEFFKMYAQNISSYVEKGYIQKLSDEEAQEFSPNTWYIPHHGVTNVNKPGKVRIVFDAAAKSQGQSLNSNLFSGPDLLNNLLGVLLRFRRHRIAVVADIEAMFCQVRLKNEDTDANRFLWRDDPNSHEPPDHYKLLVHIFGLTDSPCAATYALQRAAKDQANEFPPEVIEAILRNFYVDDWLNSYRNITSAKETNKDVITCLDNKGFNLTKFQSNNQTVLDDLPEEKLAKQPSGIQFDDKAPSRALGVHWDLETDCFVYKVNVSIDQTKPCTKRIILKKIATIYDPLGLLTPITLVAKLFMQELWRDQVEWDEEVSKSLKKRFGSWIVRMTVIASTIAVPRSLNLEEDQDVQLHIFCDASEKAFAAVAYVRVEIEGIVSCHILLSKSRVAPLKKLTLPRLELQGAVLAVRLKETVVEEIDVKFSSVQFWTDSTLNLQYINNESKRFKVFVANRVAEIRNHSQIDQWNFIPGKINPVDIATRGDIEDDEAMKCWFDGPDFLLKHKADWPMTSLTPLSSDDKEIKKQNLVCKLSCFQPSIQFERFSSWRRLSRTLAWVMKFLRPKKIARKQDKTDLSLEEERIGRQTTLKLIQREVFDENMSKELKGKLSKLDPYFDEDDELMRVGGRLKQGIFPYAVKHQVILPKDHHAVKLIVMYYHEQNHHVGTEHLISILRQEFWIIAIRTIVKRVIQKCVTCQKRRAKPSEVKMADLPVDRITAGAPTFFHTGVDYFGPIQVKVLRSKVKRWGCLFTCLVTRAVHIEVSPSLEADDFINVLNRFINRRGNPEIIRSDCGTNFVGATNELKKEIERMDNLKISKSLQQKEIKWKFNPPDAPHMGGVWERLIRSIKTTLSVILCESAILNDFTLQTVLTEIEAILNSRPLTYNSDDPNDLEPLTPNHFLLGRSSAKPLASVNYDIRSAPRQKWKQVQSMSNQFWDRWSKEYLVTLTKRSKWQTTTSSTPKDGDMVMVLEKNLVRSQWTLGRIKQTFKSSDGEVRKVDVTTKDGSYIRPLSKISLLELDSLSSC